MSCSHYCDNRWYDETQWRYDEALPIDDDDKPIVDTNGH